MDESLFPPVSQDKSVAAPIFVTPILGSHERVCIGAVSVIGESFEVETVNLIGSLKGMKSQIELVVEQLKGYLATEGELHLFKPCIADFYIGPLALGYFGNHSLAIKTILRNHSFLYGCQNV